MFFICLIYICNYPSQISVISVKFISDKINFATQFSFELVTYKYGFIPDNLVTENFE